MSLFLFAKLILPYRLVHFDSHHPLSKHANIREPLTGLLFFVQISGIDTLV